MENKCKMSIKWLSLLEQVINCGTLANMLRLLYRILGGRDNVQQLLWNSQSLS